MKRILLIFCAFLCVLLLTGAAHAEEAAMQFIENAGLDAFDRFSVEHGGDFSWSEAAEFVLEGELPKWEQVKNAFLHLLKAPLASAFSALKEALFPILLLCVMSSVLRSGQNCGAGFMCRISLYLSFAQLMLTVLNAAKDCIQTVSAFGDTASPIIAAVLTAGGLTGSSALVTPSAALAGGIIERFFLKIALPLCACGCCIVLAANLGANSALNRLIKTARRLLGWGTGLAVMLFTSLVCLKGNAAAIADTLTIRTAKYAVDSASGLIGNGVSDAWESYLSGLSIAKGAVGFSGAAALLGVCLRPMLLIGAAMLCFNLLSVALSVTGEKPAATASAQLSEICQTALTICGSGAVIWIILLGALLSLGRGI